MKATEINELINEAIKGTPPIVRGEQAPEPTPAEKQVAIQSFRDSSYDMAERTAERLEFLRDMEREQDCA